MRTPWTTGEIELLREKYPHQGTRIMELAHHPWSSIMTKANNLGLEYIPGDKRDGKVKGEWEEWEKEILRDQYPIYGANAPDLTHRARSSIYTQAEKLGLEYQKWQGR